MPASKSDSEKLVIGWLVSDMDRCLLDAPRKVINATGVLLHTGLGRAPLADTARKAIVDAAGACKGGRDESSQSPGAPAPRRRKS